MNSVACRSCGARLEHTFVDLGMSPLANSYVKPEQLNKRSLSILFTLMSVPSCFLVQLESVAKPQDIFSIMPIFHPIRIAGSSMLEPTPIQSRAVRIERQQPGGGDCQQRRLSAPVLYR